MIMRWKVAFLPPLLAVVLLLQTAPIPAQAATVTPCAAGGQVTVTTVTSEGIISLVITCSGTQLVNSGQPGGSSQSTWYPSSPCNVNVVGSCSGLENQYCAGNANALDITYWNSIGISKSANSVYTGSFTYANGTSSSGAGVYPIGPLYYHLQSGFNAPAHAVGSTIASYENAYNPGVVRYAVNEIVEVQGDWYGIAGGIQDPSTDPVAQKEILAGPVYNRLDLTGAQWKNGKDPYYTYNTNWAITGYTQQLVSAGYWNNMDLAPSDWAASKYTSYYWMDWFGANRPRVVSTPGAGAGDPSTWPAYWQYEINGESSSDGYNFSWPTQPAWVAPTYKSVPVYGWVTTATYHAGTAPTCQGGTWNEVPYLYSKFALDALSGVCVLFGPPNCPDMTDVFLWPGAIKISNPPVQSQIPSSWTNLGQLAASVTPGTYHQTKGQPNIQMVAVPFPYGMSGQTYIGQPIVKTLTVTSVDPATGVQFNVTLVGTVGLTGVKWDWGDPAATSSTGGNQTTYFGAQGLGSCSPAPFCGPTHTPTHIGNGHVNVWEYYGSDIWEFYWDPVQGGVVSKDLGSGTSGYLGCPSDPNPSSRPGGSNFCLTPTPDPAQGGIPQALAGGRQVGGLPYSVGQIEGIPNS